MKRFRPFPALSLATIALGAAAIVAPRPVAAQDLDVPFSLGRGWSGFEQDCAQCHGPQGGGTEQGPPLIHRYYVPSHHSDSAIVQAILYGTKQHHWNFGDMAPVEGISEAEAEQITAFVRWLQAEKGLLPD